MNISTWVIALAIILYSVQLCYTIKNMRKLADIRLREVADRKKLTLTFKEMGNFILNYEFPSVVIERTKKALGKDDISSEARKLKIFFILNAYYIFKGEKDNILIEMDNHNVDEYWHNFILDTKAYNEFCMEAFGRALDHIPYGEIKEISTQDQKDLMSTYVKVFADIRKLDSQMFDRIQGTSKLSRYDVKTACRSCEYSDRLKAVKKSTSKDEVDSFDIADFTNNLLQYGYSNEPDRLYMNFSDYTSGTSAHASSLPSYVDTSYRDVAYSSPSSHSSSTHSSSCSSHSSCSSASSSSCGS
jgi:hypothetical protein